MRIATEAGETIIGEHHYSFSQGGRQGLVSFDARRSEAHGIVTEGGAVEVIVEAEQATVTVHGEPGARRLLIPGEWEVREANGLKNMPSSDAASWTLDYGGGAKARIVFDRKTQPGAP